MRLAVRGWPATVAVTPPANPVPFTVSGNPALPAVTLAGLRLVMLGAVLTLGVGLVLGEGFELGAFGTGLGGVWTGVVPLELGLELGVEFVFEGLEVGTIGAETVRVWAVEVPPPGAGVRMEIFKEPAGTKSAAGIVALSWLAETKLVVRADPLTWTMDVAEKFAPIAVNGMADPPAIAVVGLMPVSEGARFGATTARGREPEVPPPGGGVITLTWAVPTPVMSAAEMLAWSCVLLT
jgi:hypothetical protein